MIGIRTRPPTTSIARTSDPARTRLLLGVIGALLLGVGGGAAVTLGNPLIPLAVVLGGVALGVVLAAGAERLMVLTLAVAILLPFATLPVKLLITPALLEIVLLLLYAVWLTRLLRGQKLNLSPIHAPLLIFVALSLFSLLLNSPRDFGTDIAHNYFRLMLGVLLFYAATSLLDYAAAKRVVRWVIVAGGAAGAIGLGLWAAPDGLTERLLRGLRIIGYPTEKVIRYVEDNPAKGERAIGTSVDPNSFAGMLVLIFALALSQLLAKKEEKLLPQWVLLGCTGASGAALLLTQSRSVWLGAAAAAGFLAIVRYRRLLIYGVVGAAVVLGSGIGGRFIARLQEGLAFTDPAQQMRLAEYRNAFTIIERYPWFGVGFGRSGELELTTGVSSVYLTVASRMGLVGLASFVVIFIVFFAYILPRLWNKAAAAGVSTRRVVTSVGARFIAPGVTTSKGAINHAPTDEQSTIHNPQSTIPEARTLLLGLTAAIVGVLVVGIPDHYYFNIEFPHMSALLWLYVGLAVVVAQTIDAPQRRQEAEHGDGH